VVFVEIAGGGKKLGGKKRGHGFKREREEKIIKDVQNDHWGRRHEGKRNVF